jgi:hypothetical protein
MTARGSPQMIEEEWERAESPAPLLEVQRRAYRGLVAEGVWQLNFCEPAVQDHRDRLARGPRDRGGAPRTRRRSASGARRDERDVLGGHRARRR